MKLYHTTLRSTVESIQNNGFEDTRDGNFCDGGVWFCGQPYWEEAVFSEQPKSEYGYFTIDVDEADVEAYREKNLALGCPEWEIPFDIVNSYFTDRTFHPFTDSSDPSQDVAS